MLLGFLLVLAVFAPLHRARTTRTRCCSAPVSQVARAPCIHLFGCPESEPQHILGIDGNGRDEFSRIVYGARLSLLSGLSARGHRPDPSARSSA